MDEQSQQPIETLRIQNFRGLKDVTIEVGDVTVLIGPQASGKSVVAKLLYYFRGAVDRHIFGIASRRKESYLCDLDRRRFRRLFPTPEKAEELFDVRYTCGRYEICLILDKETSEVAISYSPYLLKLHERLREEAVKDMSKAQSRRAKRVVKSSQIMRLEQLLEEEVATGIGKLILGSSYFVPAGRSFFASLQDSLFPLLSQDANIDPMIVDFGRLYGDCRELWAEEVADNQWEFDFRKRLEHAALGEYVYEPENEREYLRAIDGREVPIAYTSSGQQELLPLLLVLWDRFIDPDPDYSDLLIIEEPEAHLFPSAQDELVGILASVANLSHSTSRNRLLITTHSPYVLSAINNLTYAYSIVSKKPDRHEEVVRVMQTSDFIDPKGLRAYLLDEGYARGIIDPETSLIDSVKIDGASDILEQRFDGLLDIEFDE